MKNLVLFLYENAKKWDYETCKEEAKKYKTRTEFYKGNSSAYGSARKNGWLDEFFGDRLLKSWDYESCKEEASKYKSRVLFLKGNLSAYGKSRKEGWLEEFFGDKLHKSWDYESCKEEAKKYKTRNEFYKGSIGAYNKARKEGWLAKYDWLKDERFDKFKDPIDSVYAYEFTELNAVYVGRTLIRLLQKRDQEHIHEIEKDAVAKFAKENDVPVPKMKIVATDLTIVQGAKQEGEWVEKYKLQGWNILNRTKTGSIGGLGKGKWTKEACEREAKKYKMKQDFRNNNISAYSAAHKNGWLKDYDWFEIKWEKKWNYETCKEEAKKYKSLRDFEKGNGSAYKVALKKRWLEEYDWFEEKKRKNGYWNYETCKEEAMKYKSRSEFVKGSKGAYKVALKKGWLGEWFDRKIKPNGYWNYDTCKEEAKKYKTRVEFFKGNESAYNASRKNKWLDKFFPPKTLREFVEDYTEVIV